MEKKSKKQIRLFIVLVFISFLFIGLDKLGLLNWLKRPVEGLSNKIREKSYQLSVIGYQFSHLGGDLVGEEKADFLERENSSLKIKLEELEKENQAMKKLLGAPLPPNWQFIPAKVIGLDQGIMTVNQGSDIGIKPGQIVVFENVLIGQVIKANPRLAKIRLPNHKDSSIKTKEGIVVLEAGQLVLSQVLQEINLNQDQIIITSGEEDIYPKGLLIAKISQIEKNEAEVYQKAVLKPLVDYNKLEQVFVIKN